MPIGLFCHGMHGAGARKVFSSLAYEHIDVLILNWLSPMWWSTTTASLQLHPTLIFDSVNSNLENIF